MTAELDGRVLGRALTVRPPWSWAIAHGGKAIENRAGAPNRWRYRGLVWVHAGGSWAKSGEFDWRLRSAYGDVAGTALVSPDTVAGQLVHPSMASERKAARIVPSAVVAVAELVDAHLAAGCCEPWGEATFVDASNVTHTMVTHLVLEDVRPVEPPIHAPHGALGLWRPKGELADELAEWLEDEAELRRRRLRSVT